ncbi:peptidoglycan DD-metalloendopeptidase family protein [Roseibium sp. HPY-6]|uniref:peptidoglycan DD-metalloendopeptidase family protein n=1 Tax=Roseibium sp. HPY-6 TaxID=3229852 RepID=UPI00338FD351
MKKRTRTLRGDLLSKAATVSMVAVFLAGCSSAVERFGEPPYYTGNTQNQREILNRTPQPSYQDIANGPGGTSAGLPPAGSSPVTTGSVPSHRADIQSKPLPAPTQAAKAAAPVSTLPAPETVSAAPGRNWKGWTAAGGTRVTARQGDNLNSIARRYGVPVQALASVNGISDASGVRTGQSVIIPTYVYAERNGSSSTTAGETGKVKLPSVSANETIVTSSVSTVSGSTPRPTRKPFKQPTFTQISTTETVVAEADVVRVSASPKRKPAVAATQLTTASISTETTSVQVTPAVATPSSQVQKASLPAPALTQEARPTEPIKTPSVANLQEEKATTAKFRWPVRGRIISDFGTKPGGGKNEGVNLAVPEGTPVKAADAGTVIYSGNELKGYGNLVLVRHSEGWVSAYAHNSELKVKRGDKIRRGDVVGLAGATGSVNQPQVHFELRKGNKPVDPLQHLPRR